MQDKRAEADFYDKMFSRLKGDEDGHCITYGYEELIDEHVRRLAPGRLLDVGCGAGKNSCRLAKLGFDVIAVELSRAGIEAARAHAQKERQKIFFIQGDAEHLPFKNDAFDVLFCGLILHHFPEVGPLINELARVTRSHLFALEVNALEPQSLIKFNLINRYFGHPTLSRNQRALFPRALRRKLLGRGFRRVSFDYVDIHSSGQNKGILGWMRRAYLKCIRLLPREYRNNKFLLIAQKDSLWRRSSLP